MRITLKRSESGIVMIIVIIVILVLMVIAFTTLMTSRTSIKLGAAFRGKTSLYYKAEQGVNKTLAKFIKTVPSLSLWTGMMTCDENLQPKQAETGSGDSNSISCEYIHDTESGILVTVSRRPDHCRDGTVLDASKTNCESEGDSTDGQVYLINSLASDKAGRRELIQAVIIVPMLRTLIVPTNVKNPSPQPVTIQHPYKQPYIASIAKGREAIIATPTSTATE